MHSGALVELLDLYLTLFGFCGLPARRELEGRSFAGNPAEAVRERELAALRPVPASPEK